MKTLIIQCLTFLLLLFSQMTYAQMPGRGGNQENIPKEAKITGTIVDGTTKETIPYASIAIYRSRDSTLVTGVLSGSDGSFTIDKARFNVLLSRKKVEKKVRSSDNQRIALNVAYPASFINPHVFFGLIRKRTSITV